MKKTLKLLNQPDLVFASLGKKFLNLLGTACTTSGQLRMRFVLVPVIDFADYHIDTEPGQLADYAGQLLDRPAAADTNVNPAPVLIASLR